MTDKGATIDVGACLRGLDLGEKIPLILPIIVETAMMDWRQAIMILPSE
jgi:hypothetical protein